MRQYCALLITLQIASDYYTPDEMALFKKKKQRKVRGKARTEPFAAPAETLPGDEGGRSDGAGRCRQHAGPRLAVRNRGTHRQSLLDSVNRGARSAQTDDAASGPGPKVTQPRRGVATHRSRRSRWTHCWPSLRTRRRRSMTSRVPPCRQVHVSHAQRASLTRPSWRRKRSCSWRSSGPGAPRSRLRRPAVGVVRSGTGRVMVGRHRRRGRAGGQGQRRRQDQERCAVACADRSVTCGRECDERDCVFAHV